MDLKFYKCMHCGNIAIKPFDAGVPLVCCGEKMTELTANTTDAAVEKHVPVVRVDGSNVHVEVGSTLHPMTPEHYITFICLVTKNGYQIVELTPEDAPSPTSPLPKAMRLSRCTSTATCTAFGSLRCRRPCVSRMTRPSRFAGRAFSFALRSARVLPLRMFHVKHLC